MECIPVLKILNLSCYIVLGQECTGNDEGNETEEISEQLKMTDSSDVKSTEVRQFVFITFFVFFTENVLRLLRKEFVKNKASLDPDCQLALKLKFRNE